MRFHGSSVALGAALSAVLGLGCGNDEGKPANSEPASAAAAKPKKVGYDLRRLRPVDGEPLADMFERMRVKAKGQDKQIAVLFSANWCERCRRLELELGNLHPAQDIDHVRILEFVEEDWEAVTRMNEFDDLRQRWDTTKGTYPLFVVLDPEGKKVEEMKDAIERLEGEGVEATLSNWFRGLRRT
ncbi:MAG: hypothetical protein AAF799_40170 [Myxococcota bacterium]